jgi:AraC-like DNA-binding protein
MSSGQPAAAYDRVLERRRAAALARHFREAEGLSIAQIAERLGLSPATIKAYFYDPTGEKAKAVKAPLRRRVPRLRCLDAAAQRQGRHLRVVQDVPSMGVVILIAVWSVALGGALFTLVGSRGFLGRVVVPWAHPSAGVG